MNQSPLFIVIEGLDGSGGTTQSRLLQQWLENLGHQVFPTREPTENAIGEFIRSILQDPHSEIGDEVLTYLFAADRQDHLSRFILPSLQQGKMVVADRYYHSSLAYQSQSLDFDFVQEVNSRFRKPDITFFLYLPPEISFERVQLRGWPVERFETLDRLRSIAKSYHFVLEQCRQNGEYIVQIDANQTIEEIHNEMTHTIQQMLDAQNLK